MSFAHVFPFTTLVERKSATFGAKELSCRKTSARIFSHLHAFLTHLPLVSSFRHTFSSSASNAFSRQLFYVEVKLFAYKKKRPFGLGSSHPIMLPGNVLLLRNVSLLPSALKTFLVVRQALASFLTCTLSSLTYHS